MWRRSSTAHRCLSSVGGGYLSSALSSNRVILTSAAPFARTQSTEKKGLSFSDRPDLEPLLVEKEGVELIHDPIYNKGTGFPLAERDRLNIRGLVPPRCTTIEEQVVRVRSRYLQLKDNLAKYVYLDSLRDRNETLFYRLLMEDIKELAPIIYTPTVGEACLQFGSQFRRARGMYFASTDRGEMSAMIYNWPEKEVDVVVVTDGSRILGLGDLGVHGMGIPIGKLSLYVAAGGIHPSRVLPVCLDLGTNNEKLLNDKLYLGCQHRRLSGEAYFSLVDEFMKAVKLRWPKALIQFEDFSNNSAMALLQKYRNKFCCFNDDIQGTGSVALAGLLGALRAQGKPAHELTNQRIVCLGAGSAGLGVINSILDGMVEEGLPREEANKRVWLVDVEGLLGASRTTLSPDQKHLARNDAPNGLSLYETIKLVKPTILLGLSGAGASFTEEMIREMKAHCPRPIIFPLSNPTSKSECTAQQAFEWTDGSVIFASGSPFAPVTLGDKTYVPTQGNNMFIYPGIGLGVTFSQARHVTTSMFYRAAKKLASLVKQEDIDQGRIYPDVTDIREVSKHIAVEVAKVAFEEKLATVPPPPSDEILQKMVEASMYVPAYVPLIHTPTHYQRSRISTAWDDIYL